MAGGTPSSSVLRFGSFSLDLRAGELHKQGLRVKLQEQPFRVLTVLTQRPGELVTREELRSQIWPADTFVDFDNGLNTAINKLREALGDSADSPRFIQTLPRRGYRFIAPVTGSDGKVLAANAGLTTTSSTLNWKITAVIAICLLATVITVGLFSRSRQAQRLTEKDTIVLADFTNTTGDPVFEDTLKQGLRVQLEQSPFLNILSEHQVSEELKLMRHDENTKLSSALARDLCQRVGSKAVVIGSIANLGTHYVIGLNAIGCKTGASLFSEQTEADAREGVLSALGKSAKKMREKLGESLVTIQRYDTPVEEATTPSLEALQAYSIALKTIHSKGDTAALPFLQHAVQLDPNFAMAYARIANTHDILGELTLAKENIQKAYDLRQKTSDWERWYIEAHYYGIVTGNLEKVAPVYELWTQIYPRWNGPHDNLSDIYGALGRYDESLEQAREAVRLGPDIEDNYATLASAYIHLDRLNEARMVFKQAEDLKLDSEALLRGRYALAFLQGDGQEMDRLVSISAGKPNAEDALLFFHGCTEIHHGRLSKARELFQMAIGAAERAHAMERIARLQAAASVNEAYLGDPQHARADATSALKLDPNRDIVATVLLPLALAGDIRRAQNLAMALDKEFPLDTGVQEYYLPTARAALALEQNDPRRAIELLRKLRFPQELGSMTLLDPIYMRGQAYIMLHNGSAAAAEFQKVTDHPGIVGSYPLAALSRLGLARSYALQGDMAKARTAYHDFLTLWKDADPDIPILKEAKVEYAKLK
jgi:eukaryotic-like serine/threonine-protein kinase